MAYLARLLLTLVVVISSDEEEERGGTPETMSEGSDEEGDTDSFHSAMSTRCPPPA